MKTLSNIQTTVKNGKVTITADIVEKQFTYPVQQVTIGFHAEGNPHWIRHTQISQQAIFFKHLAVGFAIPIEEFNDKVAMVIEPKLSFPPLARRTNNPLMVDFCSELEPVLQWEIAKEHTGEWKPIKGQTSNVLDPKKLPAGSWVRCVASSDAGSTATPPYQLT